MYAYGPLADAPHLWATIARAYTDKDEWAARRKPFLGSLVWFVSGPAVILIPYALRAALHLGPGSGSWGWVPTGAEEHPAEREPSGARRCRTFVARYDWGTLHVLQENATKISRRH